MWRDTNQIKIKTKTKTKTPCHSMENEQYCLSFSIHCCCFGLLSLKIPPIVRHQYQAGFLLLKTKKSKTSHNDQIIISPKYADFLLFFFQILCESTCVNFSINWRFYWHNSIIYLFENDSVCQFEHAVFKNLDENALFQFSFVSCVHCHT